MSNEQTPGKIYSALIAIMREVKAIGKDRENKQQGFRFRGIDQCYNDLHALFAKHGVVTLPICGEPKVEERETQRGGVLRFVQLPVTYRFIADDGSYVEATVVGEGMDSGDKATNKSLAISHKYALMQTFLIPTEDMPDPDSESHEVSPKRAHKPAEQPVKESVQPNLSETKAKLLEAITGAGHTPEEFMEAMIYCKQLPERAKGQPWHKMKDETAQNFLDNLDNTITSITEFKKNKPTE
jgi:hypothetical protein